MIEQSSGHVQILFFGSKFKFSFSLFMPIILGFGGRRVASDKTKTTEFVFVDFHPLRPSETGERRLERLCER